MNKSSIVLLQGLPGSGKSTVAEYCEKNLSLPEFRSIRHYSIGNHLRGIRSSLIDSQYAKRVIQESDILAQSGRLDDLLVNSVVGEYLSDVPEGELTLIDGYPLYIEQIDDFRKNVNNIGAVVLGVVNIQVPTELAVQRILARGTRQNENVANHEFARNRVEEHLIDSIGTTALLSSIYRSVIVDGSKDSCVVNEDAISGIKSLLQRESI